MKSLFIRFGLREGGGVNCRLWKWETWVCILLKTRTPFIMFFDAQCHVIVKVCGPLAKVIDTVFHDSFTNDFMTYPTRYIYLTKCSIYLFLSFIQQELSRNRIRILGRLMLFLLSVQPRFAEMKRKFRKHIVAIATSMTCTCWSKKRLE